MIVCFIYFFCLPYLIYMISKKNLVGSNRLPERLCGFLKNLFEKKTKKVLTTYKPHAILKTTTATTTAPKKKSKKVLTK